MTVSSVIHSTVLHGFVSIIHMLLIETVQFCCCDKQHEFVIGLEMLQHHLIKYSLHFNTMFGFVLCAFCALINQGLSVCVH